MIIITGSADVLPDHCDEAIRLGCEHSARSRGEPGCIAHNCYIDGETPTRMHFFEKWIDADAVRAHFAVPESGAFIRDIGKMTAAPPKIEIFAAEPIDPAAG